MWPSVMSATSAAMAIYLSGWQVAGRRRFGRHNLAVPWLRLRHARRNNLAVDLGTANAVLYRRGEGVVTFERRYRPAGIALQRPQLRPASRIAVTGPIRFVVTGL